MELVGGVSMMWCGMRRLAGVVLAGMVMVASGAAEAGGWERKNYAIAGSWTIVEEGGKSVLKLGDGFQTTDAPDLKIYLSTLPAEELRDGNVIATSKVIAVLESSKGAQSYEIPAGMDLSGYKSVVIYSQQYGKVWGAANL